MIENRLVVHTESLQGNGTAERDAATLMAERCERHGIAGWKQSDTSAHTTNHVAIISPS
jgi:hypothetical protein